MGFFTDPDYIAKRMEAYISSRYIIHKGIWESRSEYDKALDRLLVTKAEEYIKRKKNENTHKYP